MVSHWKHLLTSLPLDEIVLVIVLSNKLILVLLSTFGVVAQCTLLEEPDSLMGDSEAVTSSIFTEVLAVNNIETQISEDVLVELCWSDIKLLAKVLVALDLWTSWLSKENVARLKALLVPDS